MRRRLISVIGAGSPTPEIYEMARRAGELLALRGFGVVTGGLGGVMEAAMAGARSAGGFTLAVLPGTDPSLANRYAEVVIPSGMGQARNILVVLSGEGALAVGGAAGTLSEMGHAMKSGRPLVGLNSWPVPGVPSAAGPEEAVEALLGLLPGGRCAGEKV